MISIFGRCNLPNDALGGALGDALSNVPGDPLNGNLPESRVQFA